MESARQGLTARLPVLLWFEDEARFGRINNLSRCWVAKDQRAVVTRQMIREYTYAYAAVSPQTGDTCSLISPVNNTEAMNAFLKILSTQYPDNNNIIVLDGAGWHVSKALVMPHNVRLIVLPPYSPELNPVEHLWDYIREQKKFNNHTFSCLEAVDKRLVHAFRQISQEKHIIRSMCNFSWIYSAS